MEKKNNKALTKKILSVVVCVAIAVVSFFAGYFIKASTRKKEIDTMDYILSMYKKYYYDELSDDEIVKLFADAILDDYSTYYTKEEYEIIHKASQGSHVGIGISYYSDTNEVSSINWNSSCDKAGMVPGGIITAHGKTENEMTPIVSLINGGEADSLSRAINSYAENEPFIVEVDYSGEKKRYTVSRSEYTQTFVRYYTTEGEYGFKDTSGDMEFMRIGENTTYDLQSVESLAVIDYNGFDSLAGGLYGSAGQIKRALEEFQSGGKKDIIIDLRNNGGGFMDILCEVSAHFIGAQDGKKVPVSVAKYKDRDEVYNSSAVDYSKYGFESITILANSGSASASEAFIGAVLDYDSKNIVKVIVEGAEYLVPNYEQNRIDTLKEYRTYGKGIMQTTYENFLTGEAIKLTTAKIFWPVSNISIHGVGVTTELNNTLYASGAKIFNESQNGAVYDAVSFAK